MDEESKKQLLLLGDGAAWVSSESLEQKDERDSEDEAKGMQQSSLQAERLLGTGIEYRASCDSRCYCSPSTLGESKPVCQGEALVGYPSHHHWIRLAASETNTEFISHWVFQDPDSPALEANWSRLKVSQNSFGVLRLSWPGLGVSPHSTVYYSLEWAKKGKASGSGLTPRPAPWPGLEYLKCIPTVPQRYSNSTPGLQNWVSGPDRERERERERGRLAPCPKERKREMLITSYADLDGAEGASSVPFRWRRTSDRETVEREMEKDRQRDKYINKCIKEET